MQSVHAYDYLWQSYVNNITQTLLIIGGFNWLLIGLFNLNIIDVILGERFHIITDIIYVIVGISAFWQIYIWAKIN